MYRNKMYILLFIPEGSNSFARCVYILGYKDENTYVLDRSWIVYGSYSWRFTFTIIAAVIIIQQLLNEMWRILVNLSDIVSTSLINQLKIFPLCLNKNFINTKILLSSLWSYTNHFQYSTWNTFLSRDETKYIY